ncbi:GRAM domain-containing protein [Halorhodospira halochloris]|uniref:GRAM domain-containing protein n=1 Tax=Halorhodospira halochloris TaxID=1052 RepID=UPI001EE89405|nr:GRAM domain-containing protein [Halorhodospira halochloris]MCG5549427.1 GRAM domain-containing protein [Halorhodospira halochloris]
MKTELKPNEQIIKQGVANLQKGPETVGGNLYMTNQRLIFEAHDVNIQGGITEIHLSEIESSEKCWTKLLGIIPIMPNSLAIYTKSRKEYRFVLFGRGAWAAAIEENKNS